MSEEYNKHIWPRLTVIFSNYSVHSDNVDTVFINLNFVKFLVDENSKRALQPRALKGSYFGGQLSTGHLGVVVGTQHLESSGPGLNNGLGQMSNPASCSPFSFSLVDK